MLYNVTTNCIIYTHYLSNFTLKLYIHLLKLFKVLIIPYTKDIRSYSLISNYFLKINFKISKPLALLAYKRGKGKVLWFVFPPYFKFYASLSPFLKIYIGS